MEARMADEMQESELPEEEVSESLPVLPKERYDLRILRSLRRIIRSVDSHSRRLATEHGMTVPQLLCMLKIDERGPLTVKELSREVFLNPSTIVGIVDRLERSGIFARERSDSDRRRVRISLTDEGKRRVACSPSPLQDNLVQAIDRLPELERATIALSLEKLIECIDAPLGGSKGLHSDRTAPVLESAKDLESGPPFRTEIAG
ncbi:MarR family transcriptional regulator [Pelagicoccus sp. SDUM812003]|uniref:MarR family winged helix-turn-helix transcriptional regulator n=1 Tax=Pelagicoccus sp. SDUM812003 TaxID=3041267 RepID=UPI00280E5E81|nr:MarR family transcriptional regulator [Pelagicoccus sp. SDUM812003]MDQ8202895.1 MarR family transcriptional regulator [Pelagicoccus sp. SDUM812003]